MTDLVLADCYLPESPVRPGYFHETDQGTPAAGLLIYVSNDGEHKSNGNLTFISYDSACMSCNVSTGCSIKASIHLLKYPEDSSKTLVNVIKKLLSVCKKLLSWHSHNGEDEKLQNLQKTGEGGAAIGIAT